MDIFVIGCMIFLLLFASFCFILGITMYENKHQTVIKAILVIVGILLSIVYIAGVIFILE